MGRLIFIGLLSFTGIAFSAIIAVMYFCLKRTTASGQTGMDEAVNEQTDQSRMGLGELLTYAASILAAVLFAVQLIKRSGSGFASLGRIIIVPPVIALFNARRRTGRTVFVCAVAAFVSLYLFMVYLIVGVPPKAPVFAIGDTEITLAHTTAASVIEDGFDIYIRQRDDLGPRHEELLSSGAFQKYPADQSVFVEKGFRRSNAVTAYAPYLLVKDGMVIGSIGLYGHETKDTVLEDCRIIYLWLDEDCIADARAGAVRYRFNGVELLAPLRLEELQKTFKKNLWYIPNEPYDVSDMSYGIKWTTHSDHLFWNEYYAYIGFDESGDMTSFKLSTEVARDWSE